MNTGMDEPRLTPDEDPMSARQLATLSVLLLAVLAVMAALALIV